MAATAPTSATPAIADADTTQHLQEFLDMLKGFPDRIDNITQVDVKFSKEQRDVSVAEMNKLYNAMHEFRGTHLVQNANFEKIGKAQDEMWEAIGECQKHINVVLKAVAAKFA